VKKKTLERELRNLSARHEALAGEVKRLAAHTDVLAVVVRSPEAVPAADLDATVAGIHDLQRRLAVDGTAPGN
jgi:hypothetical protein